MHSRRNPLLISLLHHSLLAVLLFASGCGVMDGKVKVGEGPLPEAVARLGGADLGCLARSKGTVKEYVNGKSNVAAVNELARCATRSLQIFAELTRGSQPGMYKPSELRRFLERYFLKDISISDSFLAEAMMIKRTV